jgi:tetratricopeptide (TPR) repeat protein
MKCKIYFVAVSFLIFAQLGFGQEAVPPPQINAAQTLKIQKPLQTTVVSREKREQAYAKLLEGQRYIWNLTNVRSRTNVSLGTRLAKESFLKAVELDPTLAEGYTALAELTYKSPPNDVDEAIRLANIAVKINNDNFGGHQVLARLHTHLSLLNRGIVDKAEAQKAVDEWKQIVRLDPRNAEGHAFLSEFYGILKQPAQRIEALKNWLSSAQPIDASFYSRVMGQQDLSPEAALVKLGEALLKDGQTRESVEILSRAISDNPNDDYAIELLNRAVESSDEKTAAKATDALQQAIFASPENVPLINLLAEIYSNAGNIDDASKLLRGSVEKLKDKNKFAAINLLISLGDIYSKGNRSEDAIATYRSAFNLSGTDSNRLVTDIDRDNAERIFEKLISTYKELNRPTDVKKTIAEASQLFGKDSLFADQMLIAFYRANGQRDEALQSIRAARVRFPQDFSLLKLEAEVLTENGKVDEGVALLKALIGKKTSINPNGSNPPILNDDFSNYLYISNLYSQAKRGKEAIEAANQALLIAKGSDRLNIAKVTLASAYQMAGNFQASEKELREVLALSPENPLALNNLGYFLLERNEKLSEALELIKKAVEISPSNPSFLDSLGWAYFKLKKWDEAEKYLKSAIRFDSSSATIFEHLGDVYEKQGNKELAKDNWRKALKITADKEEGNRLRSKVGEKLIK